MKNLTKIMIVDDQEINRRLMARILSKVEDFVVVGMATNGIEAIENVTLFQPDVILMDMEMPLMNGIEAKRIIRNTCPNVGILGYSSVEDDGLIRKLLTTGANGFLNKPAPFDKIVNTIRKLHPDGV